MCGDKPTPMDACKENYGISNSRSGNLRIIAHIVYKLPCQSLNRYAKLCCMQTAQIPMM